MKEREFTDNEEFCSKCLTHEHFWTGGGSWSPDWCPCWKSSEDICNGILWRNMNWFQRRAAKKKFTKMWNEKWGIK